MESRLYVSVFCLCYTNAKEENKNTSTETDTATVTKTTDTTKIRKVARDAAGRKKKEGEKNQNKINK